MTLEKLTTHDVCRRCRIATPKTLTRWRKRGLIPEPDVEIHPNGKGKVGYYAPWVCDRIQQVKTLLAGGESLDEIAKHLGSDWKAEEKRWAKKRPKFREAMIRSARAHAIERFSQWAADTVYDHLQQLGVQRPGISENLERMFSDSDVVDEILILLRNGCSPLAVINGNACRIVADFAVLDLIAEPELRGKPVTIVSIREAILDAFTVPELPQLPTEVRYLPARYVLELHNKKVNERKYRLKSKGGFILEE